MESTWDTPDGTAIAPPEPPRRRRLPKWSHPILGLAGALLIWGVISVAGKSESKPTSTVTSHRVTYLVTGTTNQASITYETPSGSSQQSDVDVPLKRTGDGGAGIVFQFGSGDYLYLSAQNSNDSGTVTCTINVDGEVISQNTASGAYAIASCKGSA